MSFTNKMIIVFLCLVEFTDFVLVGVMEDEEHNKELQQLHKLVAKLAMEIDAKNMRLFHLEEKYEQLTTTVKNMVMAKRKLQQDHAEGISCSTFLDIFQYE